MLVWYGLLNIPASPKYWVFLNLLKPACSWYWVLKKLSNQPSPCIGSMTHFLVGLGQVYIMCWNWYKIDTQSVFWAMWQHPIGWMHACGLEPITHLHYFQSHKGLADCHNSCLLHPITWYKITWKMAFKNQLFPVANSRPLVMVHNAHNPFYSPTFGGTTFWFLT